MEFEGFDKVTTQMAEKFRESGAWGWPASATGYRASPVPAPPPKTGSNTATTRAAAKIPAKRKDEFMSEGHVHNRAKRYMEKRLLKHLWQKWNRQVVGGDEVPLVETA